MKQINPTHANSRSTHERDLISRADAIEATQAIIGNGASSKAWAILEQIRSIPSAEAVQGYTEWLEKIIVEDGTVEWLCEDTTDDEWCEKNCKYASIQAECLRHLYEVSKGGDDK